MRLRILIVPIAALLVSSGASFLHAQEAIKKPTALFSEARDQINEGRFESAAEFLREFFAAKPTDQDYLDLESKFGPATFHSLRRVPRWYDDPNKDTQFKKEILPGILDAAVAANQKLVNDPVRIKRFVANLGGFREEQLFAINELRRNQDAAAPFLIESLRLDTNPEQRAGVLLAIRTLGAEIVPPVLAAAEKLPDDLKVLLIRALAQRPDIVNLIAKTDTNFLPLLWYLSGSQPSQPSSLRETASELLLQLLGPTTARRTIEQELVRYAESMFNRKGDFLATVPDPNDASRQNSKVVKFWEFDTTAQSLKFVLLPRSQAEERVGLTYLQWAIERNPNYDPAKSLFVALSTERAVERVKYARLAKAEPVVHRLLAAVPADMLVTLLTIALAENRTALAYGLCQIMADRGDKAGAVTSDPTRRTPALVQALNYPDSRVQLEAAVALLSTPPGTLHGAHARVIDVLTRAITGEAAGNTSTAHKVIVADPSSVRADETASLLRGLGYQTELVGTGRDLLNRVAYASDFDVILVDRHITSPTLTDVLARLGASADASRRPILVVASADKPRPLSLEPMLLRLALLIGATETLIVELPAVPPFDRRKTPEEMAKERQLAAVTRDRMLGELYNARLGRLQRLVKAADVLHSPELETRLMLRLSQLTYAVIAAEYSISSDTAPTIARDFRQTSDLVQRQTGLDAVLQATPTDRLAKIVQQLEIALTDELRQKFESLRQKVDASALGISTPPSTDPAIENSVARLTRPFPGVKVIREHFALTGMKSALETVLNQDQDPAKMPRDPAEKKASALVAIEWLRRIAVGEVRGYDIRPAEAALRMAVSNPELAGFAVDALTAIPTPTAQATLIRVALGAEQPVPLRQRAAEGAIRNIQANTALTTEKIDPTIAGDNLGLRARLVILQTLISGPNNNFIDRIKAYTPADPVLPKAEGAAPEKTEAEKKAEQEK